MNLHIRALAPPAVGVPALRPDVSKITTTLPPPHPTTLKTWQLPGSLRAPGASSGLWSFKAYLSSPLALRALCLPSPRPCFYPGHSQELFVCHLHLHVSILAVPRNSLSAISMFLSWPFPGTLQPPSYCCCCYYCYHCHSFWFCPCLRVTISTHFTNNKSKSR